MLFHKVITLKRPSPNVLFQVIRRIGLPQFPSERKDDRSNMECTRKLKKWRKERETTDTSALKVFDFRGERDPYVMPHEMLTTPAQMENWFRRQKVELLRWNQRFILERHQALGIQLAVTHFILHRNGKVRQKGCTDYLDHNDVDNIPVTYDPTWCIEEIDLSEFEICYEGLENFKDLNTLKIATFRNCKHFDDWCLERILCYCPNLEHLDISDCDKVTERGIEGVYRAWKLKTLKVTDYSQTAAFELTCLMVEDYLPDLKLELIKAPVAKADKKKAAL